MRRGEGGLELRGTLAALVLGNSRWWSALHAIAHLSLSLTRELTHESSCLVKQASARLATGGVPFTHGLT
jgi:hypothetical protein